MPRKLLPKLRRPPKRGSRNSRARNPLPHHLDLPAPGPPALALQLPVLRVAHPRLHPSLIPTLSRCVLLPLKDTFAFLASPLMRVRPSLSLLAHSYATLLLQFIIRSTGQHLILPTRGPTLILARLITWLIPVSSAFPRASPALTLWPWLSRAIVALGLSSLLLPHMLCPTGHMTFLLISSHLRPTVPHTVLMPRGSSTLMLILPLHLLPLPGFLRLPCPLGPAVFLMIDTLVHAFLLFHTYRLYFYSSIYCAYISLHDLELGGLYSRVRARRTCGSHLDQHPSW